MSQLDLACEAEISTRHLSFLETGRAAPSRDMVLHLAESLDVPLRERNQLLLAAGFAPVFGDRALDDPELAAVRGAIDAIIAAHEPYPALAVDGHWRLVTANAALKRLLQGVAADLLRPPVNVLRLTLHPKGLAPRIKNLPVCRDHLLGRLKRQVRATGDSELQALHDELSAIRIPRAGRPAGDGFALAVPLELETEGGVLSLISTTMVFGTPRDIALAELAIETLLPADAATAALLRLGQP